jgi:hypothetical protein
MESLVLVRSLNFIRLSTSPQAGCFISIPEPVDLVGNRSNHNRRS